MPYTDRPSDVIWDVTYACPLRCVHCYSESGRRPARQLRHADMLRLADAIVDLRPGGVALAGGEPLLVKGIAEIAHRFVDAGIPVLMYTSGWFLDSRLVDTLSAALTQIHVSIDGATPAVHDRIRGRQGSFDNAMRALSVLDQAAAGARPLRFGVDFVVTRSNFDQIEMFCDTVVPRFPRLNFVSFNAVAPAGLASRSGFADTELLGEAQADQLTAPANTRRLRTLLPETVAVETTDNRMLMMRPDQVGGGAFQAMQVEPDGAVRAMPIYEGTIGNLLHEPGGVLWRRAQRRWRDPFVVEALDGVRTMADWARATRRIDYQFGSQQVRDRIDRRPPFPEPLAAVAGGSER